MEAPIAHIISTAYLTLTLHFIDRQTEYLNRLDYKWNMELKEELENVNNRRIINKLLLDNILPAHVCMYCFVFKYSFFKLIKFYS